MIHFWRRFVKPEKTNSKTSFLLIRDDPSKVGPPKLGIDVSTSSIQNPNAPQNSTGGVLPNAVQMMGVSPMIGMMGGMMGHPVMPMMGGMIGDPAMLSMTGMGQVII